MNKKIKVAFDVDGTLIHQAGPLCDTPNYLVIGMFQMFESIGCDMIIWSGGGIDYAEQWARKLGLSATILEKGSILVDIAIDDLDVLMGKVNLRVKEEVHGSKESN
jgi:hydroxymethylpyrimidine pyrophosphatase-like HAD family hydrolase